ncbi:PAS domain-containing sensor histidine kinase [soil metagenome]
METEKDNNELFKHLVQGVKDYAIFALDPNGKIVTWNTGAERSKGYLASEVIGKHFSILYTEEARARKHPEFELEEAMRTGTYEEEGWRVRKDGTQFWAAVVINRLLDDSGNHLGFAKVTRDLTERRRAENALFDSTEQLQKSEAKFDLIVSAIKDYAILILSPAGLIMTWNDGAERIKGYTAEEIIGKHFSIFYTDDANAAAHPAFELERALCDGSYQEEGWRVRKDGSQFWASVTITPIGGGKMGFVKVTRDLTQRKQDELALEHARDAAVTANELKSALVANISHEVRTPLTGIVSISELLARDPKLGPDALDSAHRIFAASQRLMSILNNLLDFAKLEAGRVEIENIPFAVVEVIDEVVGLTTHKAEGKGLVLAAVISDTPEMLLGDPNKIRQVLLNLVNNAIKFTEVGGIELTVKARDGKVQFAVTDTGIGIPLEVQEKLFQPFIQGQGSTSRLFGGTGLGLSITQQFVNLMGGEVELFSEEGIGTTVWFTIPLEIPAEIPAENCAEDAVNR